MTLTVVQVRAAQQQVLRRPLTPVPPPAPKPALPAPIWKPSPNFWAGRPAGRPIAIVIHTMAGSLVATDGWFANSASQVSAHSGIGLHGERHRYVKFGDRAWANGLLESGNLWGQIGGASNPNNYTLSIETEDAGDAAMPVTDLQYAATLAEAREMLASYPVVRHLITHRSISPRSRPNCPGKRWVESGRFAQLAAELGLATIS